MPERCPTCGTEVRISASYPQITVRAAGYEGETKHYVPVAEGQLREALDLLERTFDPRDPNGDRLRAVKGVLRRHGRLTEGDSQ